MSSTGEPFDEADLQDKIDFSAAADWVSYGTRAIKVRWRAVLAGGIVTLALALFGLWALPSTYQAETTILVERTQLLAALGELSRADTGIDSGTVADTVLRRDNILALIQQTGMVEQWRRSRSPAGRLRDLLRTWTSGPLSDRDLTDALVKVLERRVYAYNKDGRVTIGIYWNDPTMAYRIVDAAQRNFLEVNHLRDVAIIEDAIALLEQRVEPARNAVQTEVARPVRSRRSAASSVAAPGAPPAVPETDPDLIRLQLGIASKRRAVEDLESFRQRRVGELQAQLAEQRTVYAESHPVIVSLKGNIATMNQDSPNLAGLRHELQELEAEYLGKGGRLLAPGDTSTSTGSRYSGLPVMPLAVPAVGAISRDPADDYREAELRMAIGRYNVLLDRIESARLALAGIRAAFKHRFVVLRPVEQPKSPLSPNRPLVLAEALIAGLGLGMVAACLLEWRRGRIVQAWQVERLVDLPVLAHLDAPWVAPSAQGVSDSPSTRGL